MQKISNHTQPQDKPDANHLIKDFKRATQLVQLIEKSWNKDSVKTENKANSQQNEKDNDKDFTESHELQLKLNNDQD